jgi:hypothetical protein
MRLSAFVLLAVLAIALVGAFALPNPIERDLSAGGLKVKVLGQSGKIRLAAAGYGVVPDESPSTRRWSFDVCVLLIASAVRHRVMSRMLVTMQGQEQGRRQFRRWCQRGHQNGLPVGVRRQWSTRQQQHP